MLFSSFPQLADGTLNAVNSIARWLAQNDFNEQPERGSAQLIILAGNAVIPTMEAAAKLAQEHQLPLLITGGIGHSTPWLYTAVAQHPRYNRVRTTGQSEAAIFADIASQFWKIPRERLLLEDRSHNSGENARYTRRLMEQQQLHPRQVILMQDPAMQRRLAATFTREWRDHNQSPQWLSYPTLVPILRNGRRGLKFVQEEAGLWPVERYLALLLGELPRLLDNSQGYGPQGRDFIDHVDIPAEILTAWQVLIDDPLLTATLQRRALL